MKHTFVFIDKIVDLLSGGPRQTIETEERKEDARRICTETLKYIRILDTLIKNHKEEKYLKRLHDAHISKISDWADQVTELFEKFDSFLRTLEVDIERLLAIIEGDRDEEWSTRFGSTGFGLYMSGLHDKENEMKRFREIAVFEMHELKGMISAEHLAELEQVLDLLE
jgi:hypothetical protein